jgi:IS30 family transposase
MNTHLSPDERYQIQALLGQGIKVELIATALQRYQRKGADNVIQKQRHRHRDSLRQATGYR